MISTLTQHYGSQRRRGQWGALGALVLILTFVALIGFVVLKPSGVNKIDWRMLGIAVRGGEGFSMGKVTFGMTPAMVRRIHPNHTAGADAYGRTVMSFAHDSGNYTVWFLDQSNRQLAFRIRYRRTLVGTPEDQVLSALAARFGRPATGTCDPQMITRARDCNYTWRVSSVDVRALIQAPPPVGPDGAVAMQLTAEDVVLAARDGEDRSHI